MADEITKQETTPEPVEQTELTDAELQAQGAEELPDREAMSLVNAERRRRAQRPLGRLRGRRERRADRRHRPEQLEEAIHG